MIHFEEDLSSQSSICSVGYSLVSCTVGNIVNWTNHMVVGLILLTSSVIVISKMQSFTLLN